MTNQMNKTNGTSKKDMIYDGSHEILTVVVYHDRVPILSRTAVEVAKFRKSNTGKEDTYWDLIGGGRIVHDKSKGILNLAKSMLDEVK